MAERYEAMIQRKHEEKEIEKLDRGVGRRGGGRGRGGGRQSGDYGGGGGSWSRGRRDRF
jgi:hypothetical protein